LELVDKQLENGVKFDWVGGDGLYGHSFELTTGLEQRGVFYLLDVHSDEKVYLTALK
jgi:SRSO17 transposase